jgi:DNA-directed RNA polymerase sigma subunit (sigma70/sigma32)
MTAANQPGYAGEPSEEEVSQFIDAHPEGGSLEEIADALGVTRARASQIVSKALVRALRNAEARGLFCPQFVETESTWQKLERLGG